MVKIWGKIIKNTKMIKEIVVVSDIDGSYQENLKACIKEVCYKLDIAKPYWLSPNVKEYNERRRTTFNQNHFIDKIDFDKFIIQQIDVV